MPLVDHTEEAVSGAVVAYEAHDTAVAEAEATKPCVQQTHIATLWRAAAAAIGAYTGRRNQQAEEEVLGSKGADQEQCRGQQGQQESWDSSKGKAPADKQAPAPDSTLWMVLSLLLPWLASAGGPNHAANTMASTQAIPAPPEKAASAPAPAPPLLLYTSIAAGSAQELSQGREAAPGEQGGERLRAFVFEQLWHMGAATDAPWLERSCARELRVTDSGLREGGLAERLFRRMGSTPAAAALLRSLVCPLTKVCTCC